MKTEFERIPTSVKGVVEATEREFSGASPKEPTISAPHGLSTNKEKLLRLTAEETAPTLPADIIKYPYVFEFLGLTPKEAFRENDLETALLDHLQDFLLELGNGFCFEDRQKNIRIGKSNYNAHFGLHCVTGTPPIEINA